MTVAELQRSLRKLRLGSMALSLETRLIEAQSEPLPHLDFLSALVTDELTRRADRLIERRVKQAAFRDAARTLNGFDFTFNPKMNRRLVFELAAGHFIDRHEDILFLGPPGTGKSHLAQAIGLAAILNGHKVRYRETYLLLEEIADATLAGTRKELMTQHETVPLLIVDDLGMRKLPASAAEDLLELIMRRHKRASTIMTSNRPVDDWGKLLGDTPAITAMLDRLLDDGHVIKCGPRSWRTRKHGPLPSENN